MNEMFELILQLHGKKSGSSTNVQSYTPTEEEKRLWQQQSDYVEHAAPNAYWLNDTARELLQDSIGAIQVDYNAMHNAAQNQLANAQQGVANLTNGLLPAEYQANMENAIRSGVQNTMGNMVSNLGSRGVLNSSVTNTAMNDISKNVSDTMAQQYSNNISNLNGLYGQQANLAGQNMVLGSAAQEAAQTPAANLWNMSLGLNGAGNQALAALGGKGTSTTTQTMQNGNAFGSIFNGLASGVGSYLGSAACFTDDTKVKTKDEDMYIRHIKAGDTVTAIDEDGNEFEDEVVATLTPRISDVYVVTTANANNARGGVSTTLTQPLMLENGEWRDVALLRIGDKLKNVGRVTGIVYSGERKVYDLKLKHGMAYYANGFVAKSATNEW